MPVCMHRLNTTDSLFELLPSTMPMHRSLKQLKREVQIAMGPKDLEEYDDGEAEATYDQVGARGKESVKTPDVAAHY